MEIIDIRQRGDRIFNAPRCSRERYAGRRSIYSPSYSRRFNKHKNLAFFFYCERINEISSSSVGISRRHLYEYSICRNNFGNAGRATYRAPSCLTGRERGEVAPRRGIVGYAWPSACAANGTKRTTWAKLRETLFRQPSDPDSLRGRSVQEQLNDSETDFPTYKTYIGGRSLDQSQTGRDGRARRIFC